MSTTTDNRPTTFPSASTRAALAHVADRHMNCHALLGTERPSCGMAVPDLADGASWQAAHVADAILTAEYGDATPAAATGVEVAAGGGDERASRYVTESGEISIPYDLVPGLGDLLLEAAGAPEHTEQCVRDRWSLLHTGPGPCVCRMFTPEQIDAAAQRLDRDGLWNVRFAPGTDGANRNERYRDILRARVRVVLAAVVAAA